MNGSAVARRTVPSDATSASGLGFVAATVSGVVGAVRRAAEALLAPFVDTLQDASANDLQSDRSLGRAVDARTMGGGVAGVLTTDRHSCEVAQS